MIATFGCRRQIGCRGGTDRCQLLCWWGGGGRRSGAAATDARAEQAESKSARLVPSRWDLRCDTEGMPGRVRTSTLAVGLPPMASGANEVELEPALGDVHRQLGLVSQFIEHTARFACFAAAGSAGASLCGAGRARRGAIAVLAPRLRRPGAAAASAERRLRPRASFHAPPSVMSRSAVQSECADRSGWRCGSTGGSWRKVEISTIHGSPEILAPRRDTVSTARTFPGRNKKRLV